MATNFVSYRTCSLEAKASQDPLDRYSQSLPHMVGIELQTINPTFFRYFKGRCHGNQLVKSKNWRFLRTNLISRTVIRKQIAISQFGFQKIRYRMNLSTSCTILVTFGPETSELYAVNNSTFCGDTAKISISRQISQNVLDYTLTYFTGLVGVLVGMIFQIFVWQLPKGRCYRNQLNMGDVRKRRMERIYFCFDIRQRIG